MLIKLKININYLSCDNPTVFSAPREQVERVTPCDWWYRRRPPTRPYNRLELTNSSRSYINYIETILLIVNVYQNNFVYRNQFDFHFFIEMIKNDKNILFSMSIYNK